MINHIGLRTTQYANLLAFYEAALKPIGYFKKVDFEVAAGLGKNEADFWIGADEKGSSNIHLAFTAEARDQVDAFYAAALANGGKDNGAPGIREDYSPNYYAAFVLDPDGNNLEMVCLKG